MPLAFSKLAIPARYQTGTARIGTGALRDMVQRCFFGCFDKNGGGIRSQKEIMDEMRDKIRIAIPMEPSCDAILEEIVLRLLDHYEVQGILTLVPSGTGYQLLGMQKELG